jgi:hypothetical protein
MKLTHVSMGVEFLETNSVQNVFFMSTESTKVSVSTGKQQTFSMETGDYISSRADKRKGIRKSVRLQPRLSVQLRSVNSI